MGAFFFFFLSAFSLQISLQQVMEGGYFAILAVWSTGRVRSAASCCLDIQKLDGKVRLYEVRCYLFMGDDD